MSEKDYEQTSIMLEGVVIPIIVEEGVEYYPISYLSEKILLRKGNIISKENFKDYGDGVKKFSIIFGEKNIQEANCVTRECLIKRLENTHAGRLSTIQRKMQNHLHRHLNIEVLSDKEHSIDYPVNFDNIDVFTSHNIKETVKAAPETIFQLCTRCDNHLPLNNRFFRLDNRTSKGYYKICLVCEGKHSFYKSLDDDEDKIREVSLELFNDYLNNKYIKVYCDDRLRFLPKKYENKEIYLKLIKHLVSANKISLDDLTASNLYKFHKLSAIRDFFTTNEIHFALFGEDSFYYPWIYPHIKRGKLYSFELAKKVFDNYLSTYNIKIDDKFSFKYGDIIIKAKIRINDFLGFVVYYNNHKHAGYKYKMQSTNYYKNNNNLLFDLKYLIEEDMKIEVDKVPLYLTKTHLMKNVVSIYNFIVTKSNRTIYDWINDLYPDKFTPLDFDINYYRDSFDSIEEAQVHEVLCENLENVLYNARNTKRTIKVSNMQPDWVVIGKEKCWFIEYFGMYVDNGGYNTVTKYYTDKVNNKIDKYENELNTYGKIYLYPTDLKNNFEGVKNKIKCIN